jgi:hypothetical protein
LERIRKYGLPWLTDYGWEVIGKVMMIIGLIGLALTQMGASWK